MAQAETPPDTETLPGAEDVSDSSDSSGRLPPADPLRARFTDEQIRPVVLVALIADTAVQFTDHPLVAPRLATCLLVLVAALGLAGIPSWRRVPTPVQIGIASLYAVTSAVLLPLAHTTAAPAFAFVATAVAGWKLGSRNAAIAVAVTGSVATAFSIWLVGLIHPVAQGWPWWLGLAAGLPVSVGIARRDRRSALASAELAAAEARRAAAAEAREAALEERGRIAREIHDVLGHSLSGIALQLEAADALQAGGRHDDATVAMRRARALAVGSMTETRRAIHALREDTLPLCETLRRLAADEAVPLDVAGTPGPLAVEAAHAVIRAAQEALTNAARYAPGALRTMRLAFTETSVSLAVANGASTEPRRSEAVVGTGMGLVGLRERTALLGGTLRAGPSRDAAGGEGWSVEVEVPR